jgi:hypothetical protein
MTQIPNLMSEFIFDNALFKILAFENFAFFENLNLAPNVNLGTLETIRNEFRALDYPISRRIALDVCFGLPL